VFQCAPAAVVHVIDARTAPQERLKELAEPR
jgi:hypothetical protein